MRQGATEDVEVWVILESGNTLEDYPTKSVFLYYNNGISDKLLAVYRDTSLTTTTAAPTTTPSPTLTTTEPPLVEADPQLGASWDYEILEIDNAPFIDDNVNYGGKMLFTISKEISNIIQDCKVRKPIIFIEVVLESDTDGVIKEEYELTEYSDSVSAGLI